MHIDGQCHCGHVKYEAEIDPARIAICHCTDCQRLTGSAYRVTVPAPAASFRLLRGTPTTYVKTGDNGNQRRHGFCPTCGTPIYSAALEEPPSYGVRVGTLDQRAALPPARQIWCRSALAWTRDLTALPGMEQQ